MKTITFPTLKKIINNPDKKYDLLQAHPKYRFTTFETPYYSVYRMIKLIIKACLEDVQHSGIRDQRLLDILISKHLDAFKVYLNPEQHSHDFDQLFIQCSVSNWLSYLIQETIYTMLFSDCYLNLGTSALRLKVDFLLLDQDGNSSYGFYSFNKQDSVILSKIAEIDHLPTYVAYISHPKCELVLVQASKDRYQLNNYLS